MDAVKVIPKKRCEYCGSQPKVEPAGRVKIPESGLIALEFKPRVISALRKEGKLHTGVMGLIKAVTPFADDIHEADSITLEGEREDGFREEYFLTGIAKLTEVCPQCLGPVRIIHMGA